MNFNFNVVLFRRKLKSKLSGFPQYVIMACKYRDFAENSRTVDLNALSP